MFINLNLRQDTARTMAWYERRFSKNEYDAITACGVAHDSPISAPTLATLAPRTHLGAHL
jgi:hypothetical protein